MKDFRLGFGPMSAEIVDAIGSYAQRKQYPLMIIASRNQVDHNSGYVMTTARLREQLNQYNREYLMLCRDHCGPYFLDSEKSLSETEAVEATKRTIAADIEQGFDLIHIDTSRCSDVYKTADELIKFCLELNPSIKFEFGTEENVGVAAGIQKYKQDVEFASQYPNMEFVVAQTGSLVMEDAQVGTFDVDIVRELVNYANEAGVKLKEHNADYLTAEQIQLRKLAGVHALNIAPQLGVMQTKFLRDVAAWNDADPEWFEFVPVVLGDTKWAKWTTGELDNKRKVELAGHYHYNSPEYREFIRRVGLGIWRTEFIGKVHKLIDLYANNL